MNDLETGNAYWGQWGGLNDVFRSRTSTYGLMPSEYAFGGIEGDVYFDAAAANQSKQTRVSYSLSNRSYRNRIMLTHSSGLMSNGWAYSVSVSKRWAKEGYVPGTFYDGYSYYAGISKVSRNHQFNLIAFGAPTAHGKIYPTTKETTELAGTNFYNPNWGYQNGEKRNARVQTNFQPTFILNYEYKPSERNRLNISGAYQFGKESNSFIDWYNGMDPRPDYYRNLPSYYLNAVPSDPGTAALVRNEILSDPNALQINWDHLYNVNYSNTETIHNVDGIAGNDVTGRRSVYVLSDHVQDVKKATLNLNYEHAFDEHLRLNAGATYIFQWAEDYNQLEDLLGGDFYVNYNQFAEREYVANSSLNQYDVNNPNRLIKVGDKYGYDYITKYNKAWAWGQLVGTYNKVDYFFAANVGNNSFSRDGLVRDGLFPNNSYGQGDVQSFFTYAIKGGLTYKIDGRNFLFANAGINADAPTIENTYISPRTRSFTVDNPIVETSKTLEAGYLLHAPRISARAVGYVTDVTNATDVQHYYDDDPQYQTFVNYVMQNINMRFIGTELALDVKMGHGFDIVGAAALGQAFYTNRPTVSVTLDNDTSSLVTHRQVYIKNYYLPVGPQSAYTVGIKYNSKQHWYANVNFNYVDRNYVEINPDRRTPEAADNVEPNSELWHQIFDQEKLPSVFTIDVFAGKSFLLSKTFKKLPRTFLYLNAGVNNLLDNKNIITGGFEQLRYDFTDNNPGKFPNKYFYGFGLNFFINATLKF